MVVYDSFPQKLINNDIFFSNTPLMSSLQLSKLKLQDVVDFPPPACPHSVVVCWKFACFKPEHKVCFCWCAC